MFDPTSRYYYLEDAEYVQSDGRTVTYKRRRFLPRPESLETLVEIRNEANSRLDRITAETLGDPLQFWRVCDANLALHPEELTEDIARRIRIPIPSL